GFLHAVAAHGLGANGSFTGPAGLDEARARAAVAAYAVAVVAVFGSDDDAVTAERHALLTRDAALPTRLERAGRAAAVTVRQVPVVASFRAREAAITARRRRHTRLAFDGTRVLRLQTAAVAAPVVAELVPVSTVLADVALAIATLRDVDHSGARTRATAIAGWRRRYPRHASCLPSGGTGPGVPSPARWIRRASSDAGDQRRENYGKCGATGPIQHACLHILPLVRALRKRSCREKQLKIAEAACGGVANIRLGGKGSGRSFSNRLKARSSVCPPPHCCSECPVRVHASVGGKRTCRRRPETRSERPGDAP